MGGINDIKNQMRERGIDVREVRMRYTSFEDGSQAQVFEFDIKGKDGIETVEETINPRDWNPKDALPGLASRVIDKIKRADAKQPAPVPQRPGPPRGERVTPKPVEPPKPKMPNIGPQGLMMAPDTPEQRRIDEAFAGTSRVIPLEAAPEVPSQTPFSLPASDTQTEQDK